MVQDATEAKAERTILSLVESDRRAAFDMMVDTFSPMLYRYAIRMCKDQAAAEDVLQDAFLTAQQKIHQFRGEGKLRNWLFTITGNACRQHHRRSSQRLASELNLDDVTPTYEDSQAYNPSLWQIDPGQQALAAELNVKLEQAIAKLPPQNRSVLVLRDLEGLSTRETAQAMDITEETVKVRLHRARAFVRNQLKDYFEGKE